MSRQRCCERLRATGKGFPARASGRTAGEVGIYRLVVFRGSGGAVEDCGGFESRGAGDFATAVLRAVGLRGRLELRGAWCFAAAVGWSMAVVVGT